MRKTVFLVIFLSSLLSSFSDNILNIELDKNKVKIGEKFKITVLVDTAEDYNVLSEIEKIKYPLELLETVYKRENNYTAVEKTFSIFEDGFFSDLYFTVVFSYHSGKVIEYRSENFTIEVESYLSEDEKEALKNVGQPEKIQLRDAKGIFKFRYYFSHIFIIIMIILLITLLILILYKILLKKIGKGRKSNRETLKLSPFEKFIAEIERINTDRDSKDELENKTSLLSEVFKDFIFNIMSFNAVSETTRELVQSLRESDIDSDLISNINSTLTGMDMVKFAKAEINAEKFIQFKSDIKEYGLKINEIVKLNKERNNEFNKV